MKHIMRNALCVIALALTLPVFAGDFQSYDQQPPQVLPQSGGGDIAPVLTTNAQGAPILSSPIIDFLGSSALWTNVGVAVDAIYAPKTRDGGHSYGVNAMALYNFNGYIGAGGGLTYLGKQGVTMPSANFQLQAPIMIAGKVQMRLFGFTGFYTSIAGEGTHNGDFGALIGAGVGLRLYKGWNAFYAIDERTTEPGPWHLGGVAWTANF